MENQNKIKITLLGNHAIGKTSLFKAYNDRAFSEVTTSTIGSD